MANASVAAYKQKLERVAMAAAKAGYGAVLTKAREIGGAMKSAVPRDKGTLAASIRLETDANNLRATIKAGGPTTTRPVRSGGPDYDYARAQEFGTSDQPANPFFFPAWRLGRKGARSAINRAMKQAIEAEMGK
jgi:HK97 gp10 family phage protein